MYFPYLRGKQYELLALKEAAKLIGGSPVIPVIEPIKQPDGGLQRCIAALNSQSVTPILIINPSVGDIKGHLISKEISDYILNTDNDIKLGLLIEDNTETEDIMESYKTTFGDSKELALIHNGIPKFPEKLQSESLNLGRKIDLVSDEIRKRRLAGFLMESDGAILHDGFPLQQRNADYLRLTESEFSDDYIYFATEGWKGFGDYLTIGKNWSEGGFTPRAVAIHWTYVTKKGDPIMIRHFTSQSNNEDIANVGGKFLEAVDKLVAFLDQMQINTEAAKVMRNYAKERLYPGLGVVKKLSIMNHIELITNLIRS